MVNKSVLGQTFLCAIGDEAGTCFLIIHKGQQYWITAKHLFKAENFPNQTIVRILNNEKLQDYNANIYYHENKDIDIAVMRFDKEYVGTVYDLGLSNLGELLLSQEMYFLGFPYCLRIKNVKENNGYPVPFVKKCILSGFGNDETNTLYLDGVNNKGFSGGPVVYKMNGKFQIAGVISGYRYNECNIVDGSANEVDLYARENSGIIIAYPIYHAISIIDSIE